MKNKLAIFTVLSLAVFAGSCAPILPSVPPEKGVVTSGSLYTIRGLAQLPATGTANETIPESNIIKESNISAGSWPGVGIKNQLTEKRNPQQAATVNSTEWYPASGLIMPRGKASDKYAFSTGATVNQIAPSATVSLIYPSSHATTPNKTIATGLTDSEGMFMITPDSGFNPVTGEIFILEVSKRIGRTGKDNITLRTFIKWTGGNWEGITYPQLYINTKTTALTIIADSQQSDITPQDTIGKFPVTESGTTVSDINTEITAALITEVAAKVTEVLAKNADPFRNIKKQNDQYIIANPTPVTAPEISRIFPRVAQPGDTVIIGGKNFSTNPLENTVTINGLQAAVTKALPDRLHITVPAGADSNIINVQTPAGNINSQEFLSVIKHIPFNTTYNISNSPGSSTNPDIIADIYGNPLAVWEDTSENTYKNIFYSRWNSTNWSLPTNLTLSNNNFFTPSIGLDKYARNYVGYEWNQNIFMSVTGTTWDIVDVGWPYSTTEPDSLTPFPMPKIAVGHNKLHAVWVENGDIIYSHTDITDVINNDDTFNNFGQWDAIYNLSGTALDSTEPDIVVDSRDIAYISWADKMNEQVNPNGHYGISYVRFNALTNQKTAAIVLSPDTSEARKPAITLDNIDRPAIAWQQDSSNSQIYFTKSTNRENTGAWTFPKNISANGNINKNTDIACDPKGYCYAAWENGTDIYYANSNDLQNNTWTTPEKISQATGTAKNPAVANDEVRNAIHVVWESNTSGNSEIYHLEKANIPPETANNRIAKITTSKGVIKMLLLEDELPVTTKNFIDLANTDFYDNLTFHRYGPNDPTPIQIVQGGNNPNVSAPVIPLEISPRYSFDRAGMVGMARTNQPDSATSQFFFSLNNVSFLDGQYSLFAIVLSGTDVVQALRAGDTITDVEIMEQ